MTRTTQAVEAAVQRIMEMVDIHGGHRWATGWDERADSDKTADKYDKQATAKRGEIQDALRAALASQQEVAQDFDAWQNNPYTKVLQKSIAEDYVPKSDKAQEVAAPVGDAPFMYAIQGPDGRAHMDENCVSLVNDLQDEVFYLNDEKEDGPYKVVKLYLATPQPQQADGRDAQDAKDARRLDWIQSFIRRHDRMPEFHPDWHNLREAIDAAILSTEKATAGGGGV